jgi:quinol monooxygenase YgiN
VAIQALRLPDDGIAHKHGAILAATAHQEVAGGHAMLQPTRSALRRIVLLGFALVSFAPCSNAQTSAAAQTEADVSPDTTFHAISYVEVMPAAALQALAALRRYRDASRARDGFVRFEIFEQTGRAGHFALAEAWRDQATFDAGAAAAGKELLDALAPIRTSGYDQRAYKTLSVVPARSAPAKGAISVVTHVDVVPDPRAAGMLTRLAEASRAEPGNLRFDVLQYAPRSNHFTVIETWRDQKSFDAHAAAAHTRRYRDELQPLTGSPLDERIFKALD